MWLDRHDESGEPHYPAILRACTPELIKTTSAPSTILHTTKMPSAIPPPEKHFLQKPTPHVPNSPLPVLIYRSILTLPTTPDSICALIESNGWLKGGIFAHYPAHHFHSITHECYAVFKGRSKLLLGKGPLDEEGGLEVEIGEGDAIVLPAGVAHCCLESEEGYGYVGLYPKVCCTFLLIGGRSL